MKKERRVSDRDRERRVSDRDRERSVSDRDSGGAKSAPLLRVSTAKL
jgi:hypothetical protein